MGQFDGYIKVKSVLGQGSTFSFSLKLQSKDSNEDRDNEEENYVDRDSFFYEWKPEKFEEQAADSVCDILYNSQLSQVNQLESQI